MRVNRIRFLIWIDITSDKFETYISHGYHMTAARGTQVSVQVKLVKYVYLEDDNDCNK